MKKFNVKVLSMAVTAAVASGAAGAAEVNFAKAVGSKADQGQAAFATVFGENTTYDKDTGKLTFKKDKDGLSDPLLVKTLELEQTINGFASGSNFITTDDNGDKTIREATNADIEADSLKGVGLAGRITAVNTRVDNLAKDVDEALDERDKAVDQLVDELKNTIASNNKKIADDMTAMGEEISDQFDAIGEDVTAVNTRVDTLEQDTAAAKASAKAAEDKVTELSANVDSKVKEAKDAADKAVDAASKIDAVADKADKASKGVEILAKAAMEALEVNRQDIDANKAAIETKADKSEVEAAQKAAAQAALATIENARELNGFKEGDQIVVTKDDGSKVIRTATKEDVENADFEGVGLKEVVTEHDEALFELAATVNDNSEALVKTAEVVNDISKDVTANKEAIETKADKADVEAAQKAAAQAALAAIENAQELNGFKEGDQIVVTKDDGSKVIRTATKEDVENADFEGVGLKEVVTEHDEALFELAATVNDNSEALVKTAEVVNAISADVNANKALLEAQGEANEGFNNAIASLDKDIGDLASAGKAAMEALEVNRQDIDANKAAIETKADKADFEELAKYTDNMGKKVNDIGDEVTALSDATSAAITRHDKDIVDLAQAGLKATEALEANRKDIDANKQGIVDLAKGLQLAAEAVEDNRKEIDANKAAIETKADKADFEELAKYTDNMGKKVNDIGDEVTALSDATSAAITRHDKDIVDLAQAGLKATEALEANRKDIDANKKYIGDLALAGKAAADALEANRQDIDANKAAIAENTAKLEEQKEANEGFNNAIASLDKDIITLKKADLAAADALKAHRTDIDANKAAIETKADKTAVESVRTIAVEAQKSAQAAKGAVEVAQKSAETADSHAKAAQTAAAKAQESADTNAVQIAANTKQIDTNKTDIAALQTANGQHAAGIAKNSARIDSLDKNVANLRKETRQGLAAQAALSGLFQPYSVGKFNVTAALGGFKSDTAVAVGAGYRFNENFAAKAGLAVGTSSGGSASYNVGLNYEW